MASAINKSKLESMKKQELITLIMKIVEDNEHLNEINRKLDNLTEKFIRLESELMLSKKVND